MSFLLISQVNLEEFDSFDLKTLKGPSDYTAVANSTEALEKIEDCMKIWIKQIEQVKAKTRKKKRKKKIASTRQKFNKTVSFLFIRF